MSLSCCGDCEINRDNIKFIPFKQVRYNLGYRSCSVCDKAWITKDRFCFCCKQRVRTKRRSKGKRYE